MLLDKQKREAAEATEARKEHKEQLLEVFRRKSLANKMGSQFLSLLGAQKQEARSSEIKL